MLITYCSFLVYIVHPRFKVTKGVRQGCIISPALFSIYMRKTLEDFEGGAKIVGRNISSLRYADNIVLITETQTDMQMLLERIDRISRDYGLIFHAGKTKDWRVFNCGAIAHYCVGDVCPSGDLYFPK